MKKIVILGTAHLSTTPGKCSPDKKFREYAFSREVVSMLEKELKNKGYTVFIDYMPADPMPSWKGLGWKTEQNRELAYRVNAVNKFCNQYGRANCVYISMHVNAAGGDGQWKNARGFTVFVSNNASDNSKKLAKIFTKNAKNMRLMGNRAVPYCEYWQANLYVLRNTYCPAVLTENMFQDNREDVAFLMSDAGKKAVVDLHVKAIDEYCR